MSDLHQVAAWAGILAGGIGIAIAARATGLASTYVRDMLHVGVGIWVLGWPLWDRPTFPIAIVCAAVVVIGVVPLAARRFGPAAAFRDSVVGDDERYGGLVIYALAYAVLTAIGLTHAPFPAAAGLWALSLGDGLGGAFGRRYGRRRYRTPFGKTKTLEGSTVVFLTSAIAVAAAAALFETAVAPGHIALLAAVAAVAEGLAPRGSDNAIVPAAVAATAYLLT